MLNLSRMYLLQTFMLLIPVSCAVFCPGCCKCGDVTPINPYILTGQQLLLYCRLDNETIQNYDVNSSHVQFIKGDTLISQNNVMILNESTAVLNITINELSDKGTYYCLFNSEKQALFDNKFVGRQVVKVEYYPQKIPEDSIHCVVYDWSYNLTCYWKTPDVKYANEENIETKVYWKNYKSFNECINIENNYCTPSTKDGSPIVVEALGWEFKFEVTNNKTNTTVRSYYRFMEFDFVKPSPVSTFSSEIINSTCVRLKWDHPRPHRDKFYEISYISKWDNEMQLLNTSIQATTIVICDLIPYTVYNFTIGVYPDEKSGYRSNLVPTKARTNQNIPDRPPEMTEGSYISSLDNCGKDIQHRNVTIYWKAVPERYLNGRLTGYTLQYREGHQLKNRPIKPDKTSEKIQVQCSHTYTMEIKAKTVVGYTENAASIKVLGTRKKDIKPPSIIHELNTTHNLVNVSWSSAYPVSEVKGYTVYWCLYTNKYICDSEINWHHVSGNESSLIIPCKNCKDTLFGVSMETSSGSSGFIWNSCLYIKDANPVPPKPVFGQSPPNKGLTVTWTADYCNGDSPYIRGYKVRYCEADKEHKTCKDKVSESKLIPTGDTKRYDIHGLDATKTYGVSVRSFSWNGESPDSELINGQPSNSDLTDGAIAGISIAGVFVACLAIAGLIFCCRVCKKKSAEIRKPYDIAVPIIKTSQLNGNGNFIGYTNISEPSTPVESHQLLNGFINGGIHANGGIQKQISRDSGHESITSETPNSPSPDQVASKPNELLVPVIEESDVSNNSNVLSSKNTEESALSENLYPNKYYSQVAMLMSESDDSSLRPSGDLTDEGRQNPVFINSSPPREKIFTVAHVTSVQLDNENPFYPNAKKSLPHNQPATTEIINPQDSSKGEASASPYVKADLGSERSSNMKTNPDGHVSDPPYISADLESGSTPVTPYVKGDLCSESNSVSPYVKGDMCSGNTSVSPNGKDGMSSGSTSVSPYVKGDLCSGSPASVSPYTSAGLIKGSENPQLGSVLENNDTSVDISNDVSDYQKANYEDFVNPLFDADLYESDKDSVSDYVTNAGIETAADRKDSVSDYVTNGGIQSAADGSSIDDYITNAAENESCIEGYVPPISEDSNSMNSAGNIANLDVSQTKSEEAQNEINDDVISESTDVDYVAEVPKPNDMDSIDASSNSEFKVSSEDESTTSSTGLLFSNPTNKNVSSDNVTNGYIYSPDLDSKDSFENINHESALPISYHNSLSTSDSEQNGYVTDLSETAVLEKKDSCSLSNPPSSAENKDSCSNSPACSSSLTTPLNNSGYLTHDVLSGEGLQSSDNKMKTNLEMNGYISEGHLKNT